MRKAIFTLVPLCGLGLLVTACPASLDDFCANRACEATASGGEGGADGGPDVVGPPPGCDPGLDSKDAAAQPCVDDEYAVFVSPSGRAGAPGTKAEPTNTLKEALEKRGAKPRVYICAGRYTEAANVTSGVTLLGGFDCATWNYTAGATEFRPQDASVALDVRASGSYVISDILFAAAPGTAALPNSIAAIIRSSVGVTLRRVTLLAQAGHEGAAGNQGAEGALASSSPIAGTLNGSPGDTTKGGLAQTCKCANGGSSKGGRGGDRALPDIDGEQGQTAQAVVDPAGADGLGTTRAECETSGLVGHNGSNAPDAGQGEGATLIGALTETGWTTAAGSDGPHGAAGQGGGGGGGDPGGGGGGSGACGGCGGSGGKGGAGGGASIALLSVESAVQLVSCVLTSADAGGGGGGGPGGAGTAGGTRSATTGGGCRGGSGGRGGNGGTGGSGSGGSSLGIAFTGTAPIRDPETDARISVGARGLAGQANGAKPGIDGRQEKVFQLP